jgi:hypothetical protein
VKNGEEFQSSLLFFFFSQRENDDFNPLARDGNDDIPDAVVVLDDVPEQYQQLRNDDWRRREIGESSNTIFIEQQHIHGTKRRGAHNARGD